MMEVEREREEQRVRQESGPWACPHPSSPDAARRVEDVAPRREAVPREQDAAPSAPDEARRGAVAAL